jgi:cardiolipin synthase
VQHALSGRAGFLRTVVLGLACAMPLGSIGCSASDRPVYYKISHQYDVSDPQFARAMGSLLGPSLVQGNATATLVNGKQIFPAMLQAIHSAKKTINFETYIYWSGTIGREFTDALTERARSGVQIHVLLDWYGSDRIDMAYIEAMKKSGIHVVRYHPFHILDPGSYALLDHRTHRKIMVIDGAVGFTGGVGIADLWRGDAQGPGHWRDNHYRVTGPVVAQLQAAFLDNWIQTTGEALTGDPYFPPLEPVGSELAQVCKSSWTGGAENMQLMFLMSVTAAAKDIRIASAYFVPDKLTRRTLIAASKRGVRVRIIVPGRHIDQQIVRSASRANWGEMLSAGIQIYEFPHTMLHCKQLVVDDLWTSIGSSNLDTRSFRLNDEANLNILDAQFAAEQSRLFDEDLSRSERVTLEQWKGRPFLEKLTDGLASILDGEI